MMATRNAGASVDSRQPWMGLSSYRETDSELFFGREKETIELLRLVRGEVLTILFGPSGTGKTSLLNAGLFPRLREAGFLPVAIRLDHSTDNPDYSAQVRALITAAVDGTASPIEVQALAPPSAPDETLWEYLHRNVFWDRRNNPVVPVLAFDQFEEIFTLSQSRAAAEQFHSGLADLVENYIPTLVRQWMEIYGGALPFPHQQPACKVLLSLREDFVWRLDSLRKAMPSVMHNRFAITRMHGEQALSAVAEPGRGLVEGHVARQIVRFVAAANQSRISSDGDELRLADLQADPALLSVVCRELNTRRIEQNKEQITEDLLEQAGTNILDDFYERAFVGLSPAVRVFVEDRLLTGSGFRSTVPLEEATQSGIAAIDISTLIDRRLIRAEERLGIPHLELTHDLLTRVVQRSRAQRHEREQRELERQRRDTEDRERAEREARRIAELRRARRWLLIVAGAAVVCLGCALLAFISYRQAAQANAAAERDRKAAERSRDDAKKQEGIAKDAQGKAVQNARIAEARQREARARELTSYSLESLAAADPERSIILAMHAVAATLATDGVVVPAAEDALHRAILSSRVRVAMPGYAGSFSPDGKHVVTVNKNGAFTLRSAANGQALFDFESKASDSLPQSMAFSPDGKYFAAAKGTQGVTIWNSADGRQFRTLKGHTGEVTNAVFSPDSTRLVTVSTDTTAKLWEIASGQELRTFRGHADRVTSAAFNSDGSRLATGSPGSAHEITKVWYTASGTEVFTVPGFGPAFSPDGTRLATIGDSTVKIWDANTGRELLTSVKVFAVESTFSPDGMRMAATEVHSAKVWDAANTKVLFTLDVPTAEVSRVGFSRDGTRLITSSRDQRVRIWDATGPRELLTLHGSPRAFGWAVFSPDFKRFATAGDQNNTAQLWDSASGRKLLTFAGPAQGHFVERIVFAPDGTRLAGINNDGTVGLWNTTKDQPLLTLRGDKEYVMAVAFAPDGRLLATTGLRETAIKIWDASSGDKLRTLPGHLGHLNNIRFSPDGRRIAAGSHDGTVELWNVEDGRELLTFKGHASPVYGVAFSPDGTRLATTNEGGRDLREGPDGTAKIWEASTGRLLLTLRGHSRAVIGVSFSPDGKRLATSGKDATVRIWDALTGQELVVLHGQSESVHEVAFSPDGKRLGAASEDGTVQVYAMDIHLLLNLARTRVTRTLTPDECKRYFQSTTCPPLP